MMVTKAVVAIRALLKSALQLSCGTGECRINIPTLIFATQVQPLRPDPNRDCVLLPLTRERDMAMTNGGKLPCKSAHKKLGVLPKHFVYNQMTTLYLNVHYKPFLKKQAPRQRRGFSGEGLAF